jgi:glycosyltransferase involved in cell wall biosynthesis
MLKKVGVFLATSPSSGGSYQWTLNILNAINDYRIARHGISVTVFHISDTSMVHSLRENFPVFRFIAIGGLLRGYAGIVRRLFLYMPTLTPVWKLVFPYNYLFWTHGIDLMVFPTTILDSGLCATKNIFFMADIAHVFYPDFPEVSMNGELRVRHLIFNSGISNADIVVVESQQLRQDIIRHYNAEPEKISVIYQVLPKIFKEFNFLEKSQALELPERFIFYPAQLWQHKNHQNLLKAMKIIVQEIPELCLILSGYRKPGDESIFQLIDQLGLQGHVKYLGYVTDQEMKFIYEKAEALVMPTYFGPTNIPTLEAFHFGCPAIISNLPGVEEQTRDAAILFDPDSEKDIAEKVLMVAQDEVLRSSLIQNGYKRDKELSYEYYRDGVRGIMDNALCSGLAIVMTGTIIPNSNSAIHSDPATRKAEYLEAIHYYRKFSYVYFLENSVYPLLADSDFTSIFGVKLIKFPVSESNERGKGYQEFEMLDAWVQNNQSLPERFIKVTGRYLIKNFDSIFSECINDKSNDIIIDQYPSQGLALTSLFCIRTSDYKRYFFSIYKNCDDKIGKWIERELFKKLKVINRGYRFFKMEPWLQGISGSTGECMRDGKFKHYVKNNLRYINSLLNNKYLYFRR